MHIRSVPFISTVTLLSLGLTSVTVMSQTKPNTTSNPNKSSTIAARKLPIIKCTDPDSMVACKSLKQLVDARDKDLMGSLTGDKDSRKSHFAYVCLRPKEDIFTVVEFDEPSPEEFRRYPPPGAAKDPVALMQEDEAFPYKEGASTMQHLHAQEKWYEDHDDYSLYEFGWVYLYSWEHGILVDLVSDLGKWQRPSPQGHGRSDEDATFESAHHWLADFNEANANQLASADDREKPRISVGDASISVQYSFKNKNDDYTDYTLNIQRSTGRFTESFEARGTDPLT